MSESQETKAVITEIGDFDWKNEEMMKKLMRGETPENIQKIAHQLCSDYVCGTWARIQPDEMVLRRISGGLTNQLYYCGIPDGVESLDGEPRELAVRIYGKKWFNFYECDEKDERQTDMIAAVLMSEKKIGPKVYGLDRIGEVQAYYDSRPFFEPEENDPSYAKELATKLAQIHYLDVPIKRRNRYFENVAIWNQRYMENRKLEEYEKLGCKYFQLIDFAEEFEFIRRCVKAMNTPTVFNHNDFRNTNILVKNNPTNDQDKLRICDYEYGCYGYRGQDFGWLFNVWGQSKITFEPVFPSDETLEYFMGFYQKACADINGPKYLEDPVNSMDSLVKEAKLFRLAFTIFGMLMFMQCSDDMFDEMKNVFDKQAFIKFGDVGLRNYFILKQRFINEKAFPEEALTEKDRNNIDLTLIP